MAKKQMRRYQRPRGETSETGHVKTRADREFNPDYTPVIKDLRRIGVLAGTFFVVLVVLSFIF